MRSTFSRTFFSAAMVLLMAMLLIGTSFQALVREYLTDQAMEGLKMTATPFPLWPLPPIRKVC